MSSHLDALRAHIHRMDVVSCMLTEAGPSREEMEAAAKRFGVDTPLYAVTHKMWNSDFDNTHLPGQHFGGGNPDLKEMENLLWFHGDTRDTLDLGGEDHKFEGSREHPNVCGPGIYFTSLLLEAVQYGPHITSARTKPGFRFLSFGGAHRFYTEAWHRSWKDMESALQQEFPEAKIGLVKTKQNTATKTVFISPLHSVYTQYFQGDARKYLAFMARHWDGLVDIGMHGASTHMVLFNPSAVEMSRVPDDLAAKSAETFAALQYHNKNKQGPRRVRDFLAAEKESQGHVHSLPEGSQERRAATVEHYRKFGAAARRDIWKEYGWES